MDESSVDANYDDTLYAIDEEAYEVAGQYYLLKLWERLCWTGGCRLCRRQPGKRPILPITNTRSVIYNAVRTCPSQPEVSFITTEMSLLEAVFRVLITKGNRPTRLIEIIDGLQEHGGAGYLQRIASKESLCRVLDAPNEYHIRRVKSSDEETAA